MQNVAETQDYSELSAGILKSHGGHFRLHPDPKGFWTLAVPEGRSLAAFGWKLHISACERDAVKTLERCLPLLFSENAYFKFASSSTLLDKLNRGEAGPTQVGKFLTIYPHNSDAAVHLAEKMEVATRGLAGPRVPSDRQLKSGSRVSYRYGAFMPQLVRSMTGEVLEMYLGFGGTLIPDRRSLAYVPPGGIEDPFVRHGVASPNNDNERVIADRYLEIATLATTRGRRVLACFDLYNRSSVVLKEAWLDNETGMPGFETKDLLSREYKNLEYFRKLHHFPQPFDLFETSDRRYLSMEYIDSPTADEYMVGISRNGHLDWQKIQSIFHEVCKIVASLHDAGYVHGDLKSSNIMIGEGCVRLVDLEFCSPIGTTLPRGVGTRGYVSEGRSSGQPVAEKDDIYALGGILYLLCSGAEPSMGPPGKPLTARPLTLLRPDLPISAQDTLQRALDGTFRTVRDVSNSLMRSAMRSYPRKIDTSHASTSNALQLALELGESIQRSAEISNDGASWTVSDRTAMGLNLKDINTGSAGTLIALCCLQEVQPNESRKQLIHQCATSLLHPLPLELQIPGLYVGLAGTAASLLRAGLTLGDERFISAGWDILASAASRDTKSPDLFNGKAGLLRSALMFYHSAGNADALELALNLGTALERASQRTGDDLYWTIPDGFGGLSGNAYFGYAHGAAGIADCLIDLFDISGDSSLKQMILGAASFLQNGSLPIGPRNEGLSWPSASGTEPTPAFWCHGAAGVARFFLRLVEREMFKTAKPVAKQALWAVANTIRWSRPTLCHGLAGGIHALLDGYHVLSEPEMLDDAHLLLKLMTAFATSADSGELLWETQVFGKATAEYMVGCSGLVPTLLRLHNPDISDPLTVAAFFRG